MVGSFVRFLLFTRCELRIAKLTRSLPSQLVNKNRTHSPTMKSGMPEVIPDNGCSLLTKGHIFSKGHVSFLKGHNRKVKNSRLETHCKKPVMHAPE